MRTARNISTHAPTARQLKLKAKYGLTDQMFHDMLVMLADLTPAERKTLKDPDFITEDEADLIVCDRRDGEPTVSLDEVLKEMGTAPRHKRST